MMMGCKAIAEYAIKKWMEKSGFVMELFSLEMGGNIGKITDSTGESMEVEYYPETKEVREVGRRE